MLMVDKPLAITAKAEALASHQRKFGGKVREGKLYPLVTHLKVFIGTPAELKADPSWPDYVVVIDPIKIELALLGMRREGFPAYFPREPRSVKKNQFQRRQIMRPMLAAGYAFTTFDPTDERWKTLHHIRYVKRVLSFDGRPVPVPLIHMERIRQREASLAVKAKKIMPMPVEVGALVQIEAGSFAGFFGKVSEVIERLARISVEVDLFGRQTPVEVSVNQVRPV